MNIPIPEIKKNLEDFFIEFEDFVRENGRDPKSISVLFATKYLQKEYLASFIELFYQLRGEKVFIGENKVQNAYEKFSFLETQRPDLTDKYYRVMIGNLQKNKINKALGLFDEIWGVDTEIARELDKRVNGKVLPVMLEVNISGEASKHGIKKGEVEKAVKEIKMLKNLKLTGLMTMAPNTKDRELVRGVFKELSQLADRFGLKTSMGMSGDWKEAILAGSDNIRIGSMIFV